MGIKRVPEVRFDNYSGEWEKQKLKDVAKFIRGSFPQPYTNPDWYDEKNGQPFVQVADIGFDLKLNKDTKSHISKIAEHKSRFVEKGKVVVALQGSIETSIGRVAITQYPAFFDRTILIFESYKVDIDNYYFAQVIQKLFHREKERAWGATISTITKEALSDFFIGLPDINEQRKIGQFLKKLNDTISLHQQELATLKQTKQGFLQKMLPKEGESLPEIRFLGFTENWEQRELGSISNKIGSGKTPRGGSSVYTQLGIPFLRSQNIYGDRVNFSELVYITETIDKEMANSRVQKNDILLNITGASIGRSAVYESSNVANVNQHVCIIRPITEIDSHFIQLNITSTKGQKQIEINQAGGGREGLNFQQISKMKFSCPANKDEQIQIGNFFKQLDEIIALQEKELEALKQTKKAFLQKMFI